MYLKELFCILINSAAYKKLDHLVQGFSHHEGYKYWTKGEVLKPVIRSAKKTTWAYPVDELAKNKYRRAYGNLRLQR